MKLDKFVLALTGTVILAWLFPQTSSDLTGKILKHASTIGIALIFFFYGLKLSADKIKQGLGNWRLHLLVQSATFIIFPFIILLFRPFIANEQQEVLWLGLFFLAALPSTVSSSVVMVSMGRGNIPAAIFNASISGIIGIVITPLWMGLFMQQTTTGFDFSEIYMRLVIQIIVPVIAGIMLQSRLHHLTIKYRRGLSIFDKSVILIIVYNSFARSFSDQVFSSVKVTDLVILLIIVIGLFFLIYGIIFVIAGLFRFNKEDRITALFCGSQKSLVHGSVFARVLFSGFAYAGIILLPLMLFHALQIFITSIIAERYGKREDDNLLF